MAARLAGDRHPFFWGSMDVQTVYQNYRIFMERLSHFPPDIAGGIASTLAMSAEQVLIETVWDTYVGFAREIAHYMPGAAGIIAADLTAAVFPGGGGGLPPGSFVLRSGDTMTGALMLAADPSANLEAATKQYVDQLFAGGQRLIGIIDASTGDVRYVAGSGFPNGPLVPPDVAGAGAYVICDVAGSIPEFLLVGDWLVSDGIAWIRLAVGTAVITAGAVVVVPPILGQSNVQDALAAIEAAKVNRAGDIMTGPLTITALGNQFTVNGQGNSSARMDLTGGVGGPFFNVGAVLRLRNSFLNAGFNLVMAPGGTTPDQTGFTLHRETLTGDTTFMHIPTVGDRVEIRHPYTLTGDPVADDELVRKAYVDTRTQPNYVLKAGDTMTGDLWVTDPAVGTGAIRLAADEGVARIRLRKNNVGQWMLEGDDIHFRVINYSPDGAAKGVPLQIEPDNRTIFIRPQTSRDPTEDDDLVRNAALQPGLDLKVNRAGDTMTGFLQTTMVQIINPADAVLRLSGPDAAVISFRRGGLALEPQWWIGTQQRVGTPTQSSMCVVRFTDPADITSGDVPLQVRYDNGDTVGFRFRTANRIPQDDDELTSKEYVDTAIATGLPPIVQEVIGVINAATGFCRYAPTTGHPDGPLVPPDQVRNGQYLICDVPGNIPELLNVGDWLISDGIRWVRLDVGTASITASAVIVIPPVAASDNVQDALAALQLTKLDTTTGDSRYLRLIGGTLTGALIIQGQDLISRINSTNNSARATLSFGAGTNRHFDIFRNNGAGLLQIDRFSDTGTATGVLAINRTTGAVTLLADAMLTLTGPPTANLHAATKAYVDTTVAAVPRVRPWTTGATYAVNEVVLYDNRTFIVVTPVITAPATPDFSTIKPLGYGQSDYWHGNVNIADWAANSWVLICTVPAYGTYSVQITDLHASNDTSLILTLVTGYNTATATVLGQSHQGTGTWGALRLSATANGAAVRLELQVATRSGTPNIKVIVGGETRGTTVNQVVIPKPLAASLDNIGGTERAFIPDLRLFSMAVTGDVEIARSGTTQGRLKFNHPTLTNADDGAISVRRHNRGLNIVGAVTETANPNQRYVSMYGHLQMVGSEGIEFAQTTAASTTDLTRHIALWGGATPTAAGFGFSITGGRLNIVLAADTNRAHFVGPSGDWVSVGQNGVQTHLDNFGYQTFAGGWFYKATGTGIVIRQSSGNQQPQIENNNGTNRREIIDTVNGDARYVLKSGGGAAPVSGAGACVDLLARTHVVWSQGADAGIGNDPPTLRANSNGIYNSNANYTGTLFLPAVNYLGNGEPFYYQSDATFGTTIRNTRTSMAANLSLNQGNTAVFIKNGSTNLWDYVGTIANGLIAQSTKFNALGNSFLMPTNRGTAGQWLVSNGTGGTSWTSGTFATADALTLANEKIAQLETRLAALEK